MSLRAIERWAGQDRDFNRPVAEAVYGTIVKMDADEAVMFSRLLVDAVLADDLMVHGEMIAKAASTEAAARVALLKSRLARTAISKARGGQDASAELVALDQLSKNFIGDMFSHAALSHRAKERQRGLGDGRFMREGPVDIDHYSSVPHDDLFGATIGNGIPPASRFANTTPAEKAAYQQAYAQVSALVRPFQRMPAGSAFVHLVDNLGRTEIKPIPHGDDAKLEADDFNPRDGRKITRAAVSVIPPETEQGAYFGLLAGLGFPVAGAVAGGATVGGALDRTRLQTYRERTTGAAGDEFTPSNKVFRRLTAGSSLIEDTLGSAAPPQAKMALQVAQHIGGLGPTAQQIIGPTVDRAAYRYRGTERTPDEGLTLALEGDARTAAEHATIGAGASREARDAEALYTHRLGQNKGIHDDHIAAATAAWERAGQERKSGVIDRGQYKAAAKHADKEIEHARRRRDLADRAAEDDHKAALSASARKATLGAQQHAAIAASIVARGIDTDNDRWRSGETLNYFKNRLPSPELNDLQLKAGNVPPSEGVILNDKGQVASQAVGYGDDHYLPFTLRGMRKMKGGSYIRTRTWGGPTAEDIRTAMLGGARRLTVVSNNGVFTVNFDPSFKGGRRHNDKAHRMIGRYEHLLDAVKSAQVSRGGIDPSMLEELEAKAALRANPERNPEGYAKELLRLKIAQRKDPQLSTAQANEAATEYLRELAVNYGTKGAETTVPQLVDEIATRKATAERATYAQQAERLLATSPDAQIPPNPSIEVRRQAEVDKMSDANPQTAAANLAAAVGDGAGLTAWMERAKQTNRDNVRELRLDGPGYLAALEALREQFPYYISRAEFHAWDNKPQKVDSGYVRPGTSHAASAQAGFFDSPNSRGKMRADSIRGQGGLAEPVKVTAEGATVKTPEQLAAATTGSDESDTDLRTRVDRSMLTALLKQQNFGPEARISVNGEDADIGGVDIRTAARLSVANGGPFPGELKLFFDGKLTDDQLHDRLDSNAVGMHGDLVAAVRWMKANKGFPNVDVDADYARIVADFESGGRAAAATDTTDTGAILARPDRDYTWAVNLGDAYSPNSGVDSQAVADAYRDDELISALAPDLPDSVAAGDFTEKSRALAAKLVTQDNALARWKRERLGNNPPVDEVEHEQRVHGLIQANTLRRRYDKATEREDDEALAGTAAAAAGEDVTNIRSVQMPAWSPEDFARLAEDPVLAAKTRAGIEAAYGKRPEDYLADATAAREREQAENRRTISP